MKNSNKKIIGLAGFDHNQINTLKKEFKNCKFVVINNFLEKKNLNADAIIAYNQSSIEEFIFKQQFKYYSKLKWMHLSIAGVDDYIENFKNVSFTITCGKIIQGINVSEHALAILLYLTRLNKTGTNFNSNPMTIFRKKVLVFGLGGIGISVAEKLSSFGCYVYSVSNKIKPNYSFIEENYIYKSKFLKDIKNFDIFVICSPLNKDTKNYFNLGVLEKMKEDSIIINVSRGKILNTNALLHLLEKDKYSAVGLDVLDEEPIPRNHKLRKYKKVLITDHTAGIASNKHLRFDLIKKNISNFINDSKLTNIYDPINEY